MGQNLPIDRAHAAATQASSAASAGDGPKVELIVRNWRSFTGKADIAAWDALAQATAEPNPFYESWNLLPALEEFDRSEQVQLWLLKVDGQLVGLVPMKRNMRYYGYPMPHWSNWTHDNCFLGVPLIARGFEQEFWSRLLAQVDGNAGPALFLHLVHMTGTGPVHLALSAQIRGSASTRPAATVLCEERAALVSRASPKAYFEESLSAKKRKELRRQQRRLEDEGELTFKRDDDTGGLTHWIDDFLDLEKRGWKGKSGSALASDLRTARLFTNALEGAARRGRLERLSLMLDGKPIAMLANFITPPGVFSFKTTFDEDYARFSPGVLLQRENLAMLGRESICVGR